MTSKKFKLLGEVFAYLFLLRGSHFKRMICTLWTEFSDWNDNGLSQFHILPLSRERALFVMKCMFELIDLLIRGAGEFTKDLQREERRKYLNVFVVVATRLIWKAKEDLPLDRRSEAG